MKNNGIELLRTVASGCGGKQEIFLCAASSLPEHCDLCSSHGQVLLGGKSRAYEIALF
jgi:hypothetical protein